jgi:hypothetical protein
MSRLLRLILTLSISLICLACAGAAWAYQHSGRQTLKHGGLEQASIQLDNPIGIDPKQLGQVSEWAVAMPEPVSLALFGSCLTLAGVVLLRSSRRTKWSANTRDAHWAVDKSCVCPARDASGVQYPGPDFPARNRYAAT